MPGTTPLYDIRMDLIEAQVLLDTAVALLHVEIARLPMSDLRIQLDQTRKHLKTLIGSIAVHTETLGFLNYEF